MPYLALRQDRGPIALQGMGAKAYRITILTSQGIQRTAYILLLGLVIYVWAVGG